MRRFIFAILMLSATARAGDGRYLLESLPPSPIRAYRAEGADHQMHIYVTDGKHTGDFGVSKHLPAKTPTYHCSGSFDADHVLKNILFDQADMNFRMAHPAQFGGGGYFIALNQPDRAFGPECIDFELAHDVEYVRALRFYRLTSDILRVDFEAASENFTWTNVELALLAIGIESFQSEQNDDWFNIFSVTPLRNPRRVGPGAP